MAATEVERTETIQRPGLSAAKSRAHLSTNAKIWMSPRSPGLRSLANNAHDRGHAHDHRLAPAHLYARGSGGRSRHHRRQARASLGGGGITRDKALPDEVVEQSPITDGLLIAESFRHEPESGVKTGTLGAVPLSPVLGAGRGTAQAEPPRSVPLSPAPGARDAGQPKQATSEAVPLPRKVTAKSGSGTAWSARAAGG
jgi:hypothetical protein